MTAAEALEAIGPEGGGPFSLEGRCPGGEVGAYYARNPEGRRLVFKWWEEPGAPRGLAAIVERTDLLRHHGYPVPQHFLPIRVASGVVLFQDAVSGAWRDDVDPELVQECLRLNDLQADRAEPTEEWNAYISRSLTVGLGNYCIHESLADYSRETRQILAWIRSVGAGLGTLQSTDLIHLDFHHRNILREGDQLTAVVDWEGIKPGDRAFDLVTFRLGFTHAVAPAGLSDLVWGRARQLCPTGDLEAYLAHMALRRLDWSIRHHGPTEVDDLVALVHHLRADLD